MDIVDEGTTVSEPVFETERSDTLDDVANGIELTTRLDQLSDRVEAEPEISVEHFNWIYSSMSSLSGIRQTTVVSNEGWVDDNSHRVALATAIKQQRNNVALAINASLEDYTDTFGSKLKKRIERNEELLKEIKLTSNKLNSTNAFGKIKSADKSIWQFVHLNGKPVKELDSAMASELSSIKKVLTAVNKAISNTGESVGELEDINIQLLNNVNVTVKEGRLSFESVKVPMPSASILKRVLAGSAVGLASILIVGSVGVLAPAMAASVAAGGAIGTAISTKGTATDARTADELRKSVKTAIQLLSLTDEIEAAAERLSAKVESNSELRKGASVLIEALYTLTDHIHGLSSGFQKLAKSALPVGA